MSSNIKIREAQKKDVEAIICLNKQLADYYRSFDLYYKPGKKVERIYRKYLKENLGKRNVKILVAEKDREIIGYISGKILKQNSYIIPKKIGEIGGIFLKKEYRNLGIGTVLLKELIKWFKKKKIEHIEIYVATKNKLAIKFWKKLGFFEYMKQMRLDL